ncbi:ATP synthase subunit O, mitochondrial [Lycorma delicatula]|uniref:ATP synthase subunit O, mitochondrial n=1 Tax=Lycorma delicatula TaxID=130591 RepID=UPI003F515DB0
MASRQIFNAVRSFSSSASQSQLVKTPMQVFGVEGRYASALYSAGSKSNQLQDIEKNLIQLQSAIKQDPKLQDFVLNPVLQKEVKVEAVRKIAESGKFSPPATNLLVLLAENGRLKKLNGIINAYKSIMAAHRGDIRCEVVSATPLDEATEKSLLGVLKSFTKKGENILLEVKVDPSIIGGLIVSIGDKYVDMSIASKIKKYTSLIQTSA